MSELREVCIADVKKMNIFGRLGKQRNPLPLLFNGSGVEVTVTGSDLWIEIETDSDFHEPWIAYELNGALMGRQMILPGEYKICLFRNMEPSTPKTVRFYRELQAMSEDDKNRILVKGFLLDGDFLEPPTYDYKVEFIGDSITSGEGTYGATPDVDWLAMYMSASKNYATMTAKALNADFHILSQGGWGVYCGWDNDVRHNIPSVYEKVCGLATGKYNEEVLGTQEPYDFSWQPDAIVVNLGTNDESSFHQPPFTDPDGNTHLQRLDKDGSYLREDQMKIIKAAVDFLTMLRKHNPKAHIVWVYGMLGYKLTMTLTEAVNMYMAESGDKNVGFINLPNTVGDGYGAHMHPGVKSHVISADVLASYLRDKLTNND